MEFKEFMESRVLKFEWALRGVGELFDSSKGEAKSKCIKSALFGGGRWQVIFYANSGNPNADGSGFVSLYLAAEPTSGEKESAVYGPSKWVRDGTYTFGFELRNIQRTICFQTKEARNHSFSWKTVNWGWAQFARRDAIYYNASTVRVSDSFLISCTITAAASPPVPPSTTLRQLVPKDLLTVMGSLLDDPMYADVEFVLPRRHGSVRGRNRKPRTIYATKKLLARVDYFDTMFQSGFAECVSSATNPGESSSNDSDSTMAPAGADLNNPPDDDMDTVSGVDVGTLPKFEDSDDEDDYFGFDSDGFEPECENEADETMLNITSAMAKPAESDSSDMTAQERTAESPLQEPLENLVELELAEGEDNNRNVQRKLSHPSSPRSETVLSMADNSLNISAQEGTKSPQVVEKALPGPSKVSVVVKDAAYATYRAVLYYIYTDTIAFAPLASSFPSFTMSSSSSASTITNRVEGQVPQQLGEPSTRREWLTAWEAVNHGKPRPCSAKAVYRLADRLDLQELKERAFQHIVKSLTVENVAYETFSHFSAAFDDVREVEINYFLEHWAEIRDSPMMRNVWQQIRMGRHPGFEEVWPLIATNLEYKSKDLPAAGRDDEKT